MQPKLILKEIANTIHNSKDRYAVHEKVKKYFEELCSDMKFIHGALKDCIVDPKFLNKRSDDNEETIINRFETYLNKTLPILDFYKGQNLLHHINGMGQIDHIFKEICGIIASLET